MDQLIKAAKVAFASQYTYYLNAQFYHWNVEGIYFQELHALFDTIYSEVQSSNDDFAENIRKMGSYAPASNSRFSVLTQINDQIEVIPAEKMLASLLQDSDNMVVILKRTYDLAEQAGEHGFSNFLAERMDAFRKHAWMLRSSLK